MSVSASIKQNWGEEVYLHGNHRKLHGSELLPWLLTAMKTGLCIESESLGSQSLTDWLRNKAAPPSGGQELQIPALSLIPHRRRRAEGLFPQLSWPGQQGTHPQAPNPSGFQWLLPNSAAPGVKGMLSNLWNFFCRETSTFEFQIPFRPPEPAHCLQESAKSQSSLASTGGLFPVYILLLLARL